MPAWRLANSGGSGDADWFGRRFLTARELVPAADFDTIIPMEFAEGITTELVDVVGVADATPSENDTGGVVTLAVGDAVVAHSAGRLQLTGAGSHVKSQQQPWYMAALVKFTQPLDVTQLAETDADMVGLWTDVDTRVALGVHGQGSGGNTTNWIGRVVNTGGASSSQVTGPALDDEESPVWHLFEAWNDGTAVHYSIDSQEFNTTIATSTVAATPAMLSMLTDRSATGDQALVNYEKAVLVVRSPTVGEP